MGVVKFSLTQSLVVLRMALTALAFGAILPIHTDLHAGSIVGEARFIDAPPVLRPVKVSKDQDYCGETQPNESYLIEPDGALKNVVVYG